jgi:SAM-dependent methyltransferase
MSEISAADLDAAKHRPTAVAAVPTTPGIRIDLQLIADMVAAKSRVLDVGCGDGTLLDYLVHFKQVDGRGMEISQAGVNACVSQGLSVIQGNADFDLKDYPPDAFDYVILSQTLQATRRMPVTESMPLQWYDSPNIHFCTILDFIVLCRELGIVVERGVSISRSGRPRPVRSNALANIFGEQGLFLLRRG